MAWQDGTYSANIQTHESKVGLLFLLNSAIPGGLGAATGLIAGAARFVSGRPVFGMDQDPAIFPSGSVSPVWGTVVSTNRGTLTNLVIGPKGYCHAAYGSTTTTTGSRTGGLWRLRRKPTSSVTEEEYFVTEDKLYVGKWPDARIHLADHAFDLHIRPGPNDLGEYILNSTKTFAGQASTAFDEFFSEAGQELSFIPALDCNVYMVAAIENSRGSAADPLRKFVTGPKCKIAAKIPTTPFPDAVIGVATIPNVSADWAVVNHVWISQVLNSGNRDGADLAEYLDMVRADDTTTYEINAYETEMLLRPGDWIWANGVPCRIRKTLEIPTSTTISAGKRYLKLNERFGEWRNAVGSIDHTNLIQSKEIDWETDHGTKKFKVLSREKTANWRARLKLSWAVNLLSVAGGGKQTASTGHSATCTPGGTYTGEDDVIYQIQTVPPTSSATVSLWHYRKYPGGAWSGAKSSGTNKPLASGVTVSFTGSFPWSTNVIPVMTWYIYAASHIDSIGHPFMIVKINDLIIPPGIIHMDNALNGSIDIDITDACAVGTNVLTAAVYDGMTETAYPNHFHSLTGSIDQYQRVGVVTNA